MYSQYMEHTNVQYHMYSPIYEILERQKCLKIFVDVITIWTVIKICSTVFHGRISFQFWTDFLYANCSSNTGSTTLVQGGFMITR
jgi:hypothetical protein